MQSLPSQAGNTLSLAAQLRAQTAVLHSDVERSLGLPGAITNLTDYKACLQRFYRLYEPLETSLSHFNDWPAIGIQLPEQLQAARLAADLAQLGVSLSRLEPAPEACLPDLPDFAHALGALYVMVGSTLGSQVILRHLLNVLSLEIGGADAFFRGHGAQTGARWSQFRTSLDAYGAERPANCPQVIEGAMATFRSIGLWMQPGTAIQAAGTSIFEA
jgi:heme oxygenase